MKRKTVTATLFNSNGATVRVTLPDVQWRESTAGHRQISTGIIRIGLHVGSRWGVIHNYSIWTDNRGYVVGDEFVAYDLEFPIHLEVFRNELSSHHYTDFITGRPEFLKCEN